MPIPPLYGHEGTRNRLVGAIASGRLPQALLFEGPRGVGKQRLALWLAQALVCQGGEARPGQGDGCGTCQQCKLVLTLSHPDVHWFVPLEPAKRSADPDKQLELVAEALGEEMAARRAEPHYGPPSGLASHGIAAVRLLLRRLVLKPVLGRRKVFLIGDAERLVAQAGAEAAANALLKALEEPPADTVFVLTAAAPEALLPTVLSRVVRVRVARLADSIVSAFGQRELVLTDQREVAQWVALADGCIGRVLADGERGAGAAAAAERFLAAVAGGPVSRYAFALARGRREAGAGDRAGAGRARLSAGQCEPATRGGRPGGRPGGTGMRLSHVDEAGRARMVDVGEKPVTIRTAVAEGTIRMSPEAYRLVAERGVAKGDALAVSEVAGTLAAKRTAELIPLCHPVGLDHVEVTATLDETLPGVRIRAAAKAVGRTGVEMEALTAVSVALLTIYDMVKAADRGMEIEKVRLLAKTGGTKGDWRRDTAD